MIKAIYLKNGKGITETSIKKIPSIIKKKPELIWLDITVENNTLESDEITLLADIFKFHELSIEDCLFPQYHPKVEEFATYVFTAVHGIRTKAKDLSDFEESIYELDLFIGSGFVVTVHTGELLIVDSLFERAKLKPGVELKSLENLLYNILHKVVNGFENAMEKLSDRLDEIEDQVLENPTNELMQEIFTMKKVLLNLRKVSEPQQNVYTYFTRGSSEFISKKSKAYFRDIFFQFSRINQSISSNNQMISSLLEIYMSGVTLKLNEVIKFLTVIATILLPALLIASYYGMNVQFPEHAFFGNDKVWYFIIGLIVAATLTVFIYIKKKKWF
ncbi:magnesium transporter CorA family protein [Elusimicrobiota bacterium]